VPAAVLVERNLNLELGGRSMLTVTALLLLGAPPPGFTVARDTVKIDKVVWYDAKGEKRVTEEPYLLIRLKVTNEADHPMRWPGFSKARVTYGTRFVGGAVLPVSFGPGSRLDNSLVADQELKAGQASTILLVFPVPRLRGPASLQLKWNGESPGWVTTVNRGFSIPAGN
jgi:hypothetical protein